MSGLARCHSIALRCSLTTNAESVNLTPGASVVQFGASAISVADIAGRGGRRHAPCHRCVRPGDVGAGAASQRPQDPGDCHHRSLPLVSPPGDVAKNLSWWIGATPLLIKFAFSDPWRLAPAIVGTAAWGGIYVLRARRRVTPRERSRLPGLLLPCSMALHPGFGLTCTHRHRHGRVFQFAPASVSPAPFIGTLFGRCDTPNVDRCNVTGSTK